MGAGASNRGRTNLKYVEDSEAAFQHPAQAFDGAPASHGKRAGGGSSGSRAPPPRAARSNAPAVAEPESATLARGAVWKPSNDAVWAKAQDALPPATVWAPVKKHGQPVAWQPAAHESAFGGSSPSLSAAAPVHVRAPVRTFTELPMPAPLPSQAADTQAAAQGRNAGREAATVPTWRDEPDVKLVGPCAAQKSSGRAAAEGAALAAIRASLNVPAAAAPVAGFGAPTTNGFGASSTKRFGASTTTGFGTSSFGAQKKSWHAQVTIESRKVILYWLKHARLRVKEKARAKQAQSAAGRQDATRKQNKADRLERLVRMYVENEEELERLCLEEPAPMLRAQMDILTHRINSLTATGKRTAARRRRAEQNDDPGSIAARAVAARRDGPPPGDEGNDHEDIPLSTSEALDDAMKKHDVWKENRNAVQQQAATSAAHWWKAEQAAIGTAIVPHGNAALVAQLREERERLAALLPLFDAHSKKQQRQEEQKKIDFVESMQEARRDAEAETLRERREKRKQEEERHRRQEEENHRRCQEAEEAVRRQEEEERYQIAEEQRRREAERRLAAEEENRVRAAMEEKEWRRREEEDRNRAEAAERREELLRQEQERWRKREAEEAEQAAKAARRAERRQNALSVLGNGDGEEEEELLAQATGLQQPEPAGGAGAKDFLHRALAALGEADDGSSSDEGEEGGGDDGGGGDLQLLQASETIAAHIERAAAARKRDGAA